MNGELELATESHHLPGEAARMLGVMRICLSLVLILVLVGCKTSSTKLASEKKCSEDANAWIEKNFAKDKSGLLRRFDNHYNRTLNKCFVTVEYRRTLVNGPSWMTVISLYGVPDDREYGVFSENHYEDSSMKKGTAVVDCHVDDKRCQNREEFNELISLYLSN
jgi:hypothetical protein